MLSTCRYPSMEDTQSSIVINNSGTVGNSSNQRKSP